MIKKITSETERLAECVGSTQDLLRRILAEEVNPNLLKFRVFVDEPPGALISSPYVDDILTECHLTFRSCFHAFYPTGSLKWLCLCDLLQHLEPVSQVSVTISIKCIVCILQHSLSCFLFIKFLSAKSLPWDYIWGR